MQKKLIKTAGAFFMLAAVTGLLASKNAADIPPLESKRLVPVDAKDIKLPIGFSAKILATDLGPTRHMVVGKNGDMYVKLSKLKDGKGIYLLRDANGDGTIEEQKLFGDYQGTGIAIKNGYLYSSSNKGIFRYKLNDKEEIIDFESPEIESIASFYKSFGGNEIPFYKISKNKLIFPFRQVQNWRKRHLLKTR